MPSTQLRSISQPPSRQLLLHPTVRSRTSQPSRQPLLRPTGLGRAAGRIQTMPPAARAQPLTTPPQNPVPKPRRRPEMATCLGYTTMGVAMILFVLPTTLLVCVCATPLLAVLQGGDSVSGIWEGFNEVVSVTRDTFVDGYRACIGG